MTARWIRGGEPGPSWIEPYRDAIAARRPFDAGATQPPHFSGTETYGTLSGRPFPFPLYRTIGPRLVPADLPKPWWEWLIGADYVIWSYETPIAWHLPQSKLDPARVPETWCVPEVRYSQTTSEHQYTALAAVQRLPEVGSGAARVLTAIPGVDPGEVRRGYGNSPYGPRRGNWGGR